MALDLASLESTIAADDTEQLRQKTLNAIQKARVAIMAKSPFFAPLVMHLQPKEDPGCMIGGLPTAATDGVHFLYHPNILSQFKTPADMVFLFLHETLHAAFSHPLRTKSRHQMLFNIACDYVVNDIIRQMGLPLLSNCLWDEAYSNLSAEKVYEMLKEKYPLPDNPGDNGEKSSGKGKGRGKGKGKQGQNSQLDLANGVINGQKVIDVHLDETQYGPQKSAQQKNGEGEAGQPIRSKLDEESLEKLRKEWEARLVDASIAYEMAKKRSDSSGRGCMPGQLQELIDGIKRPQVNIIGKLRKYVNKVFPGGSIDFNRPNARRMAAFDMYWPGRSQRVLDLCVMLDTSGSVGTESQKYFLGLLDEILLRLPVGKIRYIECDTAIHVDKTINRTQVIRSGLKTLFPNPEDIKIHGRGGTDFRLVFDRLEKEKYKPGVFLCLTDGDATFPEKRPNYPVLFVLNHKDIDRINNVVAWGDKVGFDEKEAVDWNNSRAQSQQTAQPSGIAPGI